MEERVLAQYDFRTKQAYIYRTNRLREIVGGSALITCAYDRFIQALEQKGIRVERNYDFPAKTAKLERYYNLKYTNDVTASFTPIFGTGTHGKVIYVGGGNLFILWCDKKTAFNANGILSDLMRRETYSLSPICGMAPYTGDYACDMENLRSAFQASKALLPPIMAMAALPFTRVDRRTTLPVSRREKRNKKEEWLSEESWLKLNMADKSLPHLDNDPLSTMELDDMTEKGKDSLLAVIYIDGNNMGQRVSKYMVGAGGKGIGDYATAVEKIRQFSNSITSQGFQA